MIDAGRQARSSERTRYLGPSPLRSDDNFSRRMLTLVQPQQHSQVWLVYGYVLMGWWPQKGAFCVKF